MTAAARAPRWPITVLLSLVFGILGWAGRDATLNFPLVNEPVSARLILAIGVSLIVVLPLYSAFPELELTLPREPRLRCARAVITTTLATLAGFPAWLDQNGQQIILANILLLALLISAGQVAVIFVGELAWAIPFSLGVFSVIADGGPERRISQTLESTPPILILVLALATTAAYVWRGPKR